MIDLWALTTRVAAHGLDPSASPLLTSPLKEDHWPEFLETILIQRLDGLLADAISSGAFAVTESQDLELDRHRRGTALMTLHLDQSTVELVQALTSSDIDYRVLKGPAIAYLDYPNPTQRPYIDVDILVPGSRFDDCVALLTGQGYARKFPQPRPGFDRRFAKGTVFVTPAGHEIDLHRTFVSGPYAALIDPDTLFANSESMELAGHQVRTLAAEERFLHVCFHTLLGDTPPRLLPMRDVAQILLQRPIDLERVESLCAAWQAEAVVAGALRMAWQILQVHDIVPLSAWAVSHRASRVDERRLAAYRGELSYPILSFALAREIRSFRAKAAYLRALVLPDQSYLQGRYSSRFRRWWHGGSKLVMRRLGRRADRGPTTSTAFAPIRSSNLV